MLGNVIPADEVFGEVWRTVRSISTWQPSCRVILPWMKPYPTLLPLPLYRFLAGLPLSLISRTHKFDEDRELQTIMAGDEYDIKAPHVGMSPREYAATRVSTLKPPMLNLPNPIKLLRMLNRQQWAFFMVAFCAWVCSRCPPSTMGFDYSSDH